MPANVSELPLISALLNNMRMGEAKCSRALQKECRTLFWQKMKGASAVRRAPAMEPRTWVGLTLLAVTWPLNWTLRGTPTAYLFFPLWLGYILVMDGLVKSRT
jgi:hypothetical protein